MTAFGLRWCDLAGNLLPWSDEPLEQERQRAERLGDFWKIVSQMVGRAHYSGYSR
jgi:hypothetical protein